MSPFARLRHSRWRWFVLAALVIAVVYLLSTPLLTVAGRFLVAGRPPVRAQAAMVLATGVDYYPRLMEAAALYRDGYVEQVVIDGDRKTDALRELERRGFRPDCAWYANAVKILGLLGVPRDRIQAISAEDAYDTISEARLVAPVLRARGITRLLVTTSKFHTRRAGHIWRRVYADAELIRAVAARDDPFRPAGWWREGRQIRWVLAEYGAWVYYYWQVWVEREA